MPVYAFKYFDAITKFCRHVELPGFRAIYKYVQCMTENCCILGCVASAFTVVSFSRILPGRFCVSVQAVSAKADIGKSSFEFC